MHQSAILLPLCETLKAPFPLIKGTKKAFFAVFVCIVFSVLASLFLLGIGHVVHEPIIQVTSFTATGILLFMGWWVMSFSFISLGVERANNLPVGCQQVKKVFSFKTIVNMLVLTAIRLLINGIFSAVQFLGSKFILLLLSSEYMNFIYSRLTDNNVVVLKKAVIISFAVVIALLSISIMMRLFLADAAIISEKMSCFKAIKKSFRLTHSNVCRLFFLLMVGFLGMILFSMVTLGIGSVWAIPYFYILYGVIYKKLLPNAALN